MAPFGIQYYKNESLIADIEIKKSAQILSVTNSEILLGSVTPDSLSFYKINSNYSAQYYHFSS